MKTKTFINSLKILLLGVGFLSCKTPSSTYTYDVFEPTETQFGFRILKDGNALIEQTFIPGVAGNKSFSSPEQAKMTAEIMVSKLEKGIFPPTVSQQELSLDQLSGEQ